MKEGRDPVFRPENRIFRFPPKKLLFVVETIFPHILLAICWLPMMDEFFQDEFLVQP